MNDSAIRDYAVWARRELISEVEKRCAWWGISEGADTDAGSVDGRVLGSGERAQRAELVRVVADEGYERLVERAAYTWFNRLVAIRFMEVNDRLPSHVRVLSSPDGSFEPQCLREALDLPLDALDAAEAASLVQAGDDEALFRLVFLAQCAELSECMPAVFEPVGSAMELLLPTGLLRPEGIAGRLVSDIPEGDWREGVEVVGWMYQYYVSERKDEVFASFKKGKKAERDAIAPATQLFTPHWIVRYLAENSLGRLWVLNHPESGLAERMPYFVEPDAEHETGFRRVSSPEEVTCVDPACGSGHILVYAFDLLAAMYEEAGYSARDAARLIVERNLSGFEIDPRAAAMASFALTMKACELDPRFLRRGVVPSVTVLGRVELSPEELELCPRVSERKALLDAAAHLDECGSLFQPEDEDIAAVEGDLASLAKGGSIFAASAASKLVRLRDELAPLAARYDVVVANPPYMGSSSLGKWMSTWVKKSYPDEKSDLCTSFIGRGFTLAREDGFSAMVTMQSWMFLGSYEKMRSKLLGNRSILTMAHLGTRAFGAIAGEVVSTTATVFGNTPSDAPGVYFRLVDIGGEDEKREGLVEAIADPDCGWFYRRDASVFEAIPGSPIAYWASDGVVESFITGVPIDEIGRPRVGLQTGENARFVREWWEVSLGREWFDCPSIEDSVASGMRWFPYNKGGEYRKWYGNNDCVVNWENDGAAVRAFSGSVIRNPQHYFQPSITWSKISSGSIAFRYKPAGHVFDVAGTSIFADADMLTYLHGTCNSSVILQIAGMLSPTLNFEVGQIATYPIVLDQELEPSVVSLVKEARDISKLDWDSSETSWDYLRHQLV